MLRKGFAQGLRSFARILSAPPRLQGACSTARGPRVSTPDHRTDADLLAATGDGDRAAFAVLVERYQRPIDTIARGIVHDRQYAEDVLQETFMAAFRAAKSYRGDAPVSSWLYAIARHAAYRHVRRATEIAADSRTLEELGRAAGWGSEDVALAADRARERECLQSALGQLTPEERELLTLRDGLGLSGEEAAALLGITIAAMKSRLHRARLRITAALRGEPGEPDGGH